MYPVSCYNCKKFILNLIHIYLIRYDARKNPETHASHSWISQNCKKCPNCSCRIEKADGCDHMTCAQCRYEFCWSCLADYNAIRKHGNHYHDASCKHYAAYRK